MLRRISTESGAELREPETAAIARRPSSVGLRMPLAKPAPSLPMVLQVTAGEGISRPSVSKARTW
ncbi:hypothetical protein D3C86_2036430 [compost metagenome]